MDVAEFDQFADEYTATHAANIAHGMVALDEPKVRAARCLDCHGSQSRWCTGTSHSWPASSWSSTSAR